MIKRHPLSAGRARVVALMLADAAWLLLAWTVVVSLHERFIGFGTVSAETYWRLVPIVPVYILINAIARLYQGGWMYPAMPVSPIEEFRRLTVSVIMVHAGLMACLLYFGKSEQFQLSVVAFSGVATAFLAQTARDIIRSFLFKIGMCQIPVALAGSGDTAKKIDAYLKDSRYFGLSVVLRFDDDHLRDILPKCREQDVKILLACQDVRFFRAQLRDFAQWFNHIEYIPQGETFPVFGSHTFVIDGIGGLEMVNQARMKALHWEKHALDFILASVGIVFTAPLFIIIPLIIKLTSPGSAFYRARRLGKNGVPFDVLKFRSMYQDAAERLGGILANDPKLAKEYRHRFKLHNDPRVTPFGRFLRKTSLDELPQLINVFRGEMSLIGPRPIVEVEVAEYGHSYDILRRVRPGVTGLWQCSGRSDVDYTRRVALDTYYILNWSVWMDAWICIRTFFAMILMKGAC